MDEGAEDHQVVLKMPAGMSRIGMAALSNEIGLSHIKQ
jgi:hypothetical protein